MGKDLLKDILNRFTPKKYLRFYSYIENSMGGNGPEHVKNVAEYASAIAKSNPPGVTGDKKTDIKLAEVAATLHDIGCLLGRDGHEENGKKLLESALKGAPMPDLPVPPHAVELAHGLIDLIKADLGGLPENVKDAIIETTEKHRASYMMNRTKDDRPVLCRIIADADRISGPDPLKRSFLYNLHHIGKGKDPYSALTGAVKNMIERYNARGHSVKHMTHPKAIEILAELHGPYFDAAIKKDYDGLLKLVGAEPPETGTQKALYERGKATFLAAMDELSARFGGIEKPSVGAWEMQKGLRKSTAHRIAVAHIASIDVQKGFDRAREQVEKAGQNWKGIKIITDLSQYRETFRKYGLPNAVSEQETNIPFGKGGALFVDENTGKFVAYAPSTVTNKIVTASDNAEQEVERLLKVILPGTEWANKAHAVGGYVRDQYLKSIKNDAEAPKDLDIMVDSPEGGGAEKLTKFLSDHINETNPKAVNHPHQMGKSYPIWQIIFYKDVSYKGETYKTEGAKIEFADSQKESYPDPSSRQRVTAPATVEEDIKRRDFTVNQLLKDLTTGEIKDLTGRSKSDIEKGVISGHPDVDINKIMHEDPLRLLRAIRFACKYGWVITEELKTAIRKNAKRINDISSERIMGELSKVADHGKLGQAVRMMDELGLLEHVLPEIKALQGAAQNPEYHGEGDVYQHTLMVLDNTGPGLAGQMAALLHDIGKPAAAKMIGDRLVQHKHEEAGADMTDVILRRLKFENKDIDKIKSMVRNHMRPHSLSRLHTKGELTVKAIRKFVREVGEDMVDSILSLAEADDLGRIPALTLIPELRKRIEDAQKEAPARKAPILGGKDIMSLGFPQGPIIKQIQDYLTDLEDTMAEKGQTMTKEQAIEAVKDKFSPEKKEAAIRVALASRTAGYRPPRIVGETRYHDTGMEEFRFEWDGKTYRVLPKAGQKDRLEKFLAYVRVICPKHRLNPFTYAKRDLFEIETLGPDGRLLPQEPVPEKPEPKKPIKETEQMSLWGWE